MEITIKTKDVKLNPGLEQFINKHIGVLGKFLPPNATGFIEVEIGLITKHHQKGDIYSAEILIEEPMGNVFRAYSEKPNIEMAVTDAKKEMEAQLTKFKDKLITERKKGGEEI
ncbi:MAG: HPF/RaiA family ribosome-associated protein [Candidatus Paceibacterota bacterium]